MVWQNAAAGAGLTGTKMARRMGDVDEFEFKAIGQNHNQGVSPSGIFGQYLLCPFCYLTVVLLTEKFCHHLEAFNLFLVIHVSCFSPLDVSFRGWRLRS